jgi:G:T-mismatch repair DNA endonuclease (very short patch repair protein)
MEKFLKICEYCGSEFKTSNWDNKKKFCSQQCYWKAKKTIKNTVCKNCGIEIIGNKIFCSKKCSGQFKYKQNNKICLNCGSTYHSNVKKSMFCSIKCYSIYNKNNPYKIQKKNFKDFKLKTCKYCEQEFIVHNYRNNTSFYCSQKCHFKDHNEFRICPTCGKEFEIQKNRKKMYCSNNCIIRSNDSNFEREIKKYMTNITEVESNIRIKTEKRTLYPDIVIKNKIIVECYGDYWHCNPKIYDSSYYHKQMKTTSDNIWKNDSMRIEELNNCGYKVIIIWEDEWNNEREKIKKIIDEICKN